MLARAQHDVHRPDRRARTPEPSTALALGSAGILRGHRLAGRSGLEPLRRDPGTDRPDLWRRRTGRSLCRRRDRRGSRSVPFNGCWVICPVGDSVPPTALSTFSPTSAAGYLEAQLRLTDLAFTGGLRYDQFSAGSALAAESRGSQRKLSPRFAVSTVLQGATFVASYGRFTQAPDYQYLVDAAFDDSTRTGRFRQGNPNIGFEDATQYEFSLRVRPTPITSLRLGAYVKRLDGLVASVPLGLDPDSTIFGNADAGTVKGVELLLRARAARTVFGARLAYTLQTRDGHRHRCLPAESADLGRSLHRRYHPSCPGRVSARLRPAPYRDCDPPEPGVGEHRARSSWVCGRSRGWRPPPLCGSARDCRTPEPTLSGTHLSGLPNGSRLPATHTIDLLVRRPLRLGGRAAACTWICATCLNRRNIVAVRRETGQPGLDSAEVTALAEAAYQAHPEEIPYESPGTGPMPISTGTATSRGREELFPLYLAAARDFTQPLFAYGPPRLVRLGVEILF